MLKLRIVEGPDAGQGERSVHRIHDQPTTTIGRGPGRHGDICLSDPALGAMSLEVRLVGTEYLLVCPEVDAQVVLRRGGVDTRLTRFTRVVTLRRDDQIVLGKTTLLVEDLTVDVLIDTVTEEDREVSVVTPVPPLPTLDGPAEGAPAEVVTALLEFSGHLPLCETLDHVQALVLRTVLRAFPETTHVASGLVAEKQDRFVIQRSWAIARASDVASTEPFSIPREVIRQTIEEGRVQVFRQGSQAGFERVRSAICAPLQDRGGLILGFLVAEIRSEQQVPLYDDRTRDLILLFATHAASILSVRLAEESLQSERAVRDRLTPYADGWHLSNDLLQGVWTAVDGFRASLQADTLLGTLERIEVHRRALTEYVRSLRHAADADSAQEVLPRESIVSQVKGVCANWQALARHKTLPVRMDLRVGSKWTRALANPHHLTCALTNLVSNSQRAIQHVVDPVSRSEIPANAACLAPGFCHRIQVLLDLITLGGRNYLVLYVSDTGCGMDERTQTAYMRMNRAEGYSGEGLRLGRILNRLILRKWHGMMQFQTLAWTGTVVKCLFGTGDSPEQFERDFLVPERNQRFRCIRLEVERMAWGSLGAELGNLMPMSESIDLPGEE